MPPVSLAPNDIRDDGIGFDPETPEAASRGVSLGLFGMQDQIELIGRRIAFVPEPAGWSEVQVHFPNTPSRTARRN